MVTSAPFFTANMVGKSVLFPGDDRERVILSVADSTHATLIGGPFTVSGLTFDLIDTWNGRSIGGCSYHVSHPGGRSYEKFPVNSLEAESRRINRFGTVSYTQGPFTPLPAVDALREFFPERHVPRPMAPPPEEAAGEYPYILDMRRPAHT